ncbi:MAG: NAD(P)/FAD-dependent oxidoreductase [Flavobacterium sp.]|nr:MAG: NAD(P)/FAD-dependent oxidoreductase [Flavobacterium sp.]
MQTFDVIIVGGSVAGLSAALALGRSLRNVLVIDAGQPCNRQSPHSHNFLTQDGTSPADLIAIGKKQFEQYQSVSFVEEKVIRAEKRGAIFEVETESGKRFESTTILLATGLSDISPEIEGFSDCWGISILHCPYCHGYEVRDQQTAILANGEAAYHTGMLIHNWTKNLTILTNGVSELRHIEHERLTNLGVEVIETEIKSIQHSNGSLEKILFVDGSEFSAKALYASIPFTQQSPLAEMLGCKMTQKGHIEVDNLNRTTVEGVYAAGDNTAEHRAISVAAAAGTIAGFCINGDLVKMKMPAD